MQKGLDQDTTPNQCTNMPLVQMKKDRESIVNPTTLNLQELLLLGDNKRNKRKYWLKIKDIQIWKYGKHSGEDLFSMIKF